MRTRYREDPKALGSPGAAPPCRTVPALRPGTPPSAPDVSPWRSHRRGPPHFALFLCPTLSSDSRGRRPGVALRTARDDGPTLALPISLGPSTGSVTGPYLGLVPAPRAKLGAGRVLDGANGTHRAGSVPPTGRRDANGPIEAPGRTLASRDSCLVKERVPQREDLLPPAERTTDGSRGRRPRTPGHTAGPS